MNRARTFEDRWSNVAAAAIRFRKGGELSKKAETPGRSNRIAFRAKKGVFQKKSQITSDFIHRELFIRKLV
jgi:hypothetical protein